MKLALAITSLLLICDAAGVASADKKDKAEALFKQGKKQMSDKRYADACESFEQSYKLDPVIGTQLNVAKCYEEWGKLARAYTSYQLAEKMARDNNDPRADKIKELITTLDTQVPRLTIKIPKDVPKDYKVTMDRQPITVFGEAFVVDPGPKTLEWWVGKGTKKQKIVAVERGGESEVTLDIPKATDTKKKPNGDGKVVEDDKKPVKTPPAPGRNQRIGGMALAGAGVVAIGVSSIMTLSARGKYNDALDMHCGGMKNGCDATGLEITRDARSTANTATVLFLVGTAAVGGGVALYLLAPKGRPAMEEEEQASRSRYIVPAISPDGAGIVFGGTY